MIDISHRLEFNFQRKCTFSQKFIKIKMSSVESKSDWDSGQNDLLKLKMQLEEATTTNQRLINEKDALQKHYDDIMIYFQQMDDVHKKNIELSKTVSTLIAEKDDINRRLEISLQMNEEYKQKMQKMTITKTLNDDHELKGIKSQLIKEKEESAKEIQKLNTSIQSLTEQLLQQQENVVENHKSLSTILDAGQVRFGQQFSSISQFQQFLLSTPIESKEPEVEFTSFNNEINEYKTQINHFKQLAKHEKKSRLDFEKKLENQEKEYKKYIDEKDRVIEELKLKISKVQTELEKQLTQLRSDVQQKELIINNQEITIDKMKRQINKEKAKLKESMNKTASPQTKVISPVVLENEELKKDLSSQFSKCKEFASTISVFKKKSASLNQQLQMAISNNETLKRNIREYEEKTQNLIKENEELRASLTSTDLEKEDCNMQKDLAESQFKALTISSNRLKSMNDDLSMQLSHAKQSISILETMYQKQKKEIIKYMKKREKIIDIVHKQSYTIKLDENELNKLSKEVSSLKSLLEEEKQKLKMIPEPVVPEPLSFNASCFPRDLSVKIVEIGSSDCLSDSLKIGHMFSAINQYFSDIIDQQQKQINRFEEEQSHNNTIIEHFHNQLSKVLDISFSTNELLTNPLKSAQLIDSINKINESQHKSEQEKSNLEEELLSILMKLNANNSKEAISEIEQFIYLLKIADKKLMKERSKYQKIKKSHHDLEEEFYCQRQEIESNVIGLNNKLTDLTNENSHLAKLLDETKNEVVEKEKNIKYMKNKHDQEIESCMSNKESILEQIKNDFEIQKASFIKEINDLKQNVIDLTQKIGISEQEITKWKKTALLMKNSSKAKTEQLHQCEIQIGEIEKAYQRRMQMEQLKIKEQNDKMIQQLKARNNDLRNLLDKATASLNESELHIKQLLHTNNQQAIEKQQLELKLDSQKEESKRNSQLIEAKMKATAFSNELKMQSLITQQKEEFDKHKGEIFSLISKSFRHYFDARIQMDDSSLKSIIEAVARDIERFSQQDSTLRQLLGINECDSIEKSVTNLLLPRNIC